MVALTSRAMVALYPSVIEISLPSTLLDMLPHLISEREFFFPYSSYINISVYAKTRKCGLQI